MEVARLYLDANILILLGEGQSEISNLLVDLVASQQKLAPPFLCTSELTLAEVLVKPYREHNEGLIDLYESWLAKGSFMEVAPVRSFVLRYSALLRANYKSIKLPDPIHLSTAIGLSCSHFLSADLQLPDRIEPLHPRWGVTRGSAILEVIRPQPDVLRNLLKARSNL